MSITSKPYRPATKLVCDQARVLTDLGYRSVLIPEPYDLSILLNVKWVGFDVVGTLGAYFAALKKFPAEVSNMPLLPAAVKEYGETFEEDQFDLAILILNLEQFDANLIQKYIRPVAKNLMVVVESSSEIEPCKELILPIYDRHNVVVKSGSERESPIAILFKEESSHDDRSHQALPGGSKG